MMTASRYITRQCNSRVCGFRFPVYGEYLNMKQCPRCGSETTIVEKVADSPVVEPGYPTHETQIHLEGLLDNIRSAFNVGSMFRTSDGAALEHLHLCGMTATPENSKISKTALGAEYSVPWTYYPNTFLAAENAIKQGYRLWALEGGKNAQSIYQAAQDVRETKTILIIGNEVSGVDPGLISQCERTVFIPMLGFKRSLNVAIAFGIAVYTLKFSQV